MRNCDDDHPELEALTPDERAAFRRALRARRNLRGELGEASTLLAAAALFFLFLGAGVAGAMALWLVIWPWTGPALSFPGGVFVAMLGALSIGLAIQGTGHFLRRARQLEDRRMLLVHLFDRRARCPACGYELAGLSDLPERPGVVRCPECALINPAPTTNA